METAILLLHDSLIQLKEQMAKPQPEGKNEKQKAFLKKARDNQAKAICEIKQAISLLKSENAKRGTTDGAHVPYTDDRRSMQAEQADADIGTKEVDGAAIERNIEDGNICPHCGVKGKDVLKVQGDRSCFQCGWMWQI